VQAVRADPEPLPSPRFVVSFLLPVLRSALSALRTAWARVADRGVRCGLGAKPAEVRATGAPDPVGSAEAARCARLLGMARWRARLRLYDTRLATLLEDVNELLDDLDVTLVRCHPVRDAGMFASAARLHRDLERIQASVPSARRRRLARHLGADARAASQWRHGIRPRDPHAECPARGEAL
jgi:hypothetical protein